MSLLVLRKLINNKWMFVCLLIGFLIVATVVSSIPMFTDAVLQRVLILDLQEYQASYNQYPGTYTISQTFSASSYMGGYDFNAFNGLVEDTAKGITVPKLADVTRITMTRRAFIKAPYDSTSIANYTTVNALSGLADKVTVMHGKMYSPGLVDGVYEAVVSEYSMKTLQLSIGSEYWVTYPFSTDELFSSDQPDSYFKIKIVGVVSATDVNDPYWFYDMATYTNNIFLDYDAVVENLGGTQHITEAVWYKAYDYTKIEVSDIRDLINTLDKQQTMFGSMGGAVRFNMPTLDIMKNYLVREQTLQVTLWVLIMPLMVLLCFYIFMVSRLKLQNEANEISVLKSRGASMMQIFSGYIFEWGIMAGVALILGPPLGYLTCYFLGSSNGFLDFVSRTALPVDITWKSYAYTAAAMVLFAIAMLIPAVKASRLSIVERKQLASRVEKKPLWQKMFLDVILLGASIYMLVRYNNSLQSATNALADMGIDPLMFVITSLFMLGAGLLFLRVYPYIVRFIFFLGKKRWSPAMYSSFIRIGRSSGKEVFVMLFIIYSIAIGVFSANSARTVNTNLEDRCVYSVGTDVIADLKTSYLAEAPDNDLIAAQEGIGDVAQVINIKSTGSGSTGFTIRTSGDSFNNFSIMGIEPYSFGTVAKMRSTLLPVHINNYLNAINGVSNAVLLSSDFSSSVAVGDSITLTSSKDTSLTCIVYGFFDYWPGFETVSYVSGIEQTNSLIVMNSSYLLSYFPNSAAGHDQLWMTRTEGSTINQVRQAMVQLVCTEAAYDAYSSASQESVDSSTGSPAVTKLTFLSQSLVKVKNDPTIQGFNGMLSLVFLITMGITTVGFLIYWVLSLKSRTLQFGVYRALGMSQKGILGMIMVEQVLVSVVAILTGLVLGDVTSYFCVPLFEMVYSAQERLIPFVVVHQAADYFKIYFVIALMLLIGFIVLRKVVSSIKIDQALKLGED